MSADVIAQLYFYILLCGMAFLKVERKESGNYLRIVEGYREGGKSRNRVLYSLGRVEDYTPGMLKRFGERFYELGGGDPCELLGGGVEELGRYNYGYYQLFYRLLCHYGLDKTFARIKQKHKLSFDLVNAVMLMLIERLHDPCSKRANYFNQSEYLGIETVELQWLYRSLDYLAENNQYIQNSIYKNSFDLFNQTLDVVFYDVTTLYFESEAEQEGTLRQKGFSKDGKIGSTQILFGLLIDKHKQPIGYQIYSGDTYEGHTFKYAIGKLKQQYNINHIIVVADRGMLNKHNIELTEKENGYEFIIGERLKTLPSHVQQPLLDMKNYKQEWIHPQDKTIRIQYTVIEHEGRNIISTYSQTRAKKDKMDREKKLQTAEYLIKNPGQLKKKAHHYFLSSNTSHKYELNQERIKQSEKYDGILAISTNAKNLSVAEVLDNYRHLYQIEQTFRTFKSYLEIRPMFHWTDTRIQGHICLCYIAYALLNQMKLRLEKAKMKMTENQLRKLIDKMQLSLVKQRDKQFYLRSAMEDGTRGIINKMGLRALPNIIPKEKIMQYI